MSRLTNEQVKFIDDYLYNAGVKYIDIRCEMTDHVATAIEEKEGDFGERFFGYMALHKRELLASNKNFRKQALSKAGSMFVKTYKKPVFLLATAALVLLTFVMKNMVGFSDVSDTFMLVHLFIYTCFYISWIFFWLFKSNRYSVIDRLLIISFFMPALFRFEKIIDNETVMLSFYCLYTSIVVAMLLTVVNLYRTYRIRFKFNG